MTIIIVILKILTFAAVVFGVYQLFLAVRIKNMYSAQDNKHEEESNSVVLSSESLTHQTSIEEGKPSSPEEIVNEYLLSVEEKSEISKDIRDNFQVYSDFVISCAEGTMDNDPRNLQTLLIKKDRFLALKILKLPRRTLLFLMCFILTDKIAVYKIIEINGMPSRQEISPEKLNFITLSKIDEVRCWKFYPSHLKLNIP